MLFGTEPTRVRGVIRRDPAFGTDVLTSALLDFDGRHDPTCSTQLESDQRVHIHGTTGNPGRDPVQHPVRPGYLILVASGGEPPVAPDITVHEVAAPTNKCRRMRSPRLRRDPVPTPPADAIANLEVMERILADAEASG